jgi:SAM-dependent methyltransferase
MAMALYDRLAPWYHLLDPAPDHEPEAAQLIATFRDAITGPRETLLELGAGAGNTASFLAHAYRCTLSEPSDAMRALSEARNPGAAHVGGDMRSLRLDRRFDAVLIHDAIVYMRSREELRAAMETAFVHVREGGAAILVPDAFRGQLHEYTQLHEGDEGDRSLRALEWCWDPDPDDELCTVEWSFLARRGTEMLAIHDRHVEGLFAREVWIELARDVGFDVSLAPRPLDDADPDVADAYASEWLVCRRRG